MLMPLPCFKGILGHCALSCTDQVRPGYLDSQMDAIHVISGLQSSLVNQEHLSLPELINIAVFTKRPVSLVWGVGTDESRMLSAGLAA